MTGPDDLRTVLRDTIAQVVPGSDPAARAAVADAVLGLVGDITVRTDTRYTPAPDVGVRAVTDRWIIAEIYIDSIRGQARSGQ